jgi:CRISPR type III-B/RAMP module RAMP protein Cmr1
MISDIVYSKAFDGEFHSVTPWWGGGPYGTVKDEKCNIWYPSAETINGKTKWFVRHLLWTCEDGEFNHVELEKRVEELFGYVGKKSPKTSTLRLVVNASEKNKSRPSLDTRYEGVPRVELGHMGNKWDYLEEYDYPVDGLTINVKIFAPAKELFGDSGSSINSAKKLAAAIMLTLAYAGIGKAANRGFGRFYPNIDQLNQNSDQDLAQIAKLIVSGEVEDQKEAITKGAELLLNKNCADKITKMVHFVQCPGNGKPIADAMTIINNAFIKRNNPFMRRQKGDFSVLGLPRAKKKPAKPYERDGTKHYEIYERRQSPLIASPIVKEEKLFGVYKTVKGVMLIELYHGDFDTGEILVKDDNKEPKRPIIKFEDALGFVRNDIARCQPGRPPSNFNQHTGGNNSWSRRYI